MQSFAIFWHVKSIDRCTYCMKPGSASYNKCTSGSEFLQPYKTTNIVFNTYNYHLYEALQCFIQKMYF